MENNKKNTPEKIELRSEKVRKLLGEIPPSLVTWGTVIILSLFIALACALVFIPSPYGQHGESILQYILESL